VYEEVPVITTKRLESITKKDTIFLSMRENENYADGFYRNFHDYKTAYNDNGDKITYSRGIKLRIRSTRDSVAKIKVIKTSKNDSFETAKALANNISYEYELAGNELVLDNHFVIPNEDIKRDQEVEIVIYLPVGSTLFAEENVHKFNTKNCLLANSKEGYYLTVENGKLICNNCPKEETDDDFEIDVNVNNENTKIKLNAKGLEAKTDENTITIDNKGVKGSTKNVKVNIDENGVKISSEKKK